MAAFLDELFRQRMISTDMAFDPLTRPPQPMGTGHQADFTIQQFDDQFVAIFQAKRLTELRWNDNSAA